MSIETDITNVSDKLKEPTATLYYWAKKAAMAYREYDDDMTAIGRGHYDSEYSLEHLEGCLRNIENGKNMKGERI